MRNTSWAKRYFNWLCELVRGEQKESGPSYRRLLRFLHDTEYTYILDMDKNRASDGAGLRYRFGYWNGLSDNDVERYFNGPCSVLEMMIAIAVRCEEDVMSDSETGDRTGQWFWSMVGSLGLVSMTDQNFDKRTACEIIDRFLLRNYEPNGSGGLFTLRNSRYDLRTVEIWHQAMWYLDEYLSK